MNKEMIYNKINKILDRYNACEIIESGEYIGTLIDIKNIVEENGSYSLLYQLYKKEKTIKEAREYIEKNKHLNWYVESCYVNDLLQILDGDSEDHIIEELEKWLKEEIPNTMDTMKRFALNDVLNKLQELKGESND